MLDQATFDELLALMLKYLHEDVQATKVLPQRDRVLVRPLAGDYVQRRPSGIYTVSEQNKLATFYLVVRVPAPPEGEDKDPDGLREGMIAVAGRHVGHPVKFQGVAYRMLPRADILGVLDRGGAPATEDDVT